MKLRPLIKDQKLFIDAHGHEREDIHFEDEQYDIHLHKKTNYRIGGKIQEVNIRIPLNSMRPVTITNARSKYMDVPLRLLREIQEAFSDEELRSQFVREISEIIQNYFHVFWNKELAKKVLARISKFFDLPWDDEYVIFSANLSSSKHYSSYTAYINAGDDMYQLTMDFEGITIQPNNKKDISVICNYREY